MKKVKLIGKKVMSVGLAASLLLAPVSTNSCSAIWGFNFFNRGQAQQNQHEQETDQFGQQDNIVDNEEEQQGNLNLETQEADNQTEEQNQAQQQKSDIKSKVFKSVKIGVLLLLIAGLAYYGYSNKDTIGNFIESNKEFINKIISENKPAVSNAMSECKNDILKLANYILGPECKEDIMGLMSSISGKVINVGKAVGSVGYAGYDLVCSLCKLVSAIGPKNILSAFGAVSIWNKGKGAYNKVKAWFKGEKKQSGVQNFNVNLKISN